MSSTAKIRLSTAALPAGSLIVVTGASGSMGVYICDQLLQLNYRVRGISRDAKRTAWLGELLFERHGAGKFELAEVPDFTAEGAFDKVLEGAHGVVHTAVDNSLDLNPDNIIPKMQAATLGIATAAAKTPTCRRLVYTSSSSAVAEPAPGVIRELTMDSYNEETVRAAYSSDLRHDLVGGHTVYAAGKVKTEQALWDWYRGETPRLVMNTDQWTATSAPARTPVVSVIPSPCYGGILDPNHQKFSAANGMLKTLWEGNESEEIVKMFEAQWFCDVQDVSALHVGALLLPDIASERLFAYGGKYTVNDLLAAFKALQPDRKFPNLVKDIQPDLSTVPNGRSTDVPKSLGLPGWKSLEDCLRPLVSQFAEATKRQTPC
ncbi:Putative NAD-dependent epimerase/dehydratase, NAD(P)-binding domain superfamily [Colletotrichum destructivum]|uniref:NAD-dependent epimerase/dehydratase, NAD(P)-binding domain superfamily n=1 Tax=Colletotrichum destructivum TaxID=34406 RepID=A0AAX4I6S8_9PEZI|nr:Putative NAD-dependent epimerase/dehydratase, NAD(P)-binding domain superfamily [Colletotrichum destructivum]